MKNVVSHVSRVIRIITVAWLIGSAAIPATGLEINVTYTPLPNQMPHSDDPNGDGLKDIVEAAGQHYMDIIGDAHTLNLTVSWADLSDASGSGVLGVAGVPNSTGRISTASISFDTKFNGTERPWYFDDTPFDDEEYLLTQVLYGQLPPQKQTDGYNGTAPDPFEVGYFGGATDPNVLDKIDLLTTALHEIAHTLGYTTALDTTVTETADGDYDTPPNLLRGATTGIRIAPGDAGHLAVDQSVVCGDGSCVGAQFVGRRIRPSASDLFGIAKVNNFTNIDLKRQDFIGGAEWNLANNWEGNTVPDAGDIVGVRHDGFVVITDSPAAASTLIVGNDSDLIADHTISVANSITVESNSSLTIDTGGIYQFN